jgi:uridine monophosphate synthetase
VVEILKEVDHLTEEEVERINEFIKEIKLNSKKKKTFLRTKIRKCEHSFAKKLLEIAIEKNLTLLLLQM